jgi:hypothetical protein
MLKIKIRDDYYRFSDTYTIQQQAGTVSSSSVEIKVLSTQSVPRALADCTIYDDDTPILWGIIQSVESPEFKTGFEVEKYKLNIQSGECLFNNRLVSEAFISKYTHEIVKALFEAYIADEGLTLGEILTSTQLYDNYNCSYTKLYDVLTELAEDINASFYVSADKKFYFVDKSSFVQINAPTHITGLKIEEEKGDMRTVQIVTGATEDTSTQETSTVWTEGQSTWLLGYSVSTMSGITINGVKCGVGKLGVDEEDTSKTFLYEIGSNTLTLNSKASTVPAAGAICVCVYTGYYDIVVTDVNDSLISEISALNGTSGRIEQILTDDTITTFSDADTKAIALLDSYSEREQTISCECFDLGATALYKMWLISQNGLRISGSYVVTERTLSKFGPGKQRSKIKLKNKNYFARYGKVLVSSSKTVGSDVKVYKQTAIGDVFSSTDLYQISSAGLAFWPTDGNGTDMYSPNIDGFYPGV